MIEALNEQYEKVLGDIYALAPENLVSRAEVLSSSEGNHDNGSNKNHIAFLKKRIKYCKNPMEKKKLEKELNLLYKERKRKI